MIMSRLQRKVNRLDMPDAYFGACPECGEPGRVVHVGRTEFGVCGAHRVFWWVGENILSLWKEQPESHWQQNATMLQTMREVKPLYPKPPFLFRLRAWLQKWRERMFGRVSDVSDCPF